MPVSLTDPPAQGPPRATGGIHRLGRRMGCAEKLNEIRSFFEAFSGEGIKHGDDLSFELFSRRHRSLPFLVTAANAEGRGAFYSTLIASSCSYR